MTTKNCANGPKLVLKDLYEKSFVQNVLYSCPQASAHKTGYPVLESFHEQKGLRVNLKQKVNCQRSKTIAQSNVLYKENE